MSDVGFFILEDCSIDVKVNEGDLSADQGLETSILISLFTDGRAGIEELPSGQSSRRGWWGDMFPDVDNDEIGSKLWTIDNKKQLLQNLPIRETIIKSSLNWMITDNVASEIQVVSDYPDRGIVRDSINITRPGGISRFDLLWNGQALKIERF